MNGKDDPQAAIKAALSGNHQTPSRRPDEIYLKEEEFFWATQRDEQNLSNERERQKIENIKQDREMRSEYANKVYNYLVYYSGFCVSILLLQGIGHIHIWFVNFSFHLSETSIPILIGSTAVSAISLVAIVLHGLFKTPLQKRKKRKNRPNK